MRHFIELEINFGIFPYLQYPRKEAEYMADFPNWEDPTSINGDHIKEIKNKSANHLEVYTHRLIPVQKSISDSSVRDIRLLNQSSPNFD